MLANDPHDSAELIFPYPKISQIHDFAHPVLLSLQVLVDLVIWESCICLVDKSVDDSILIFVDELYDFFPIIFWDVLWFRFILPFSFLNLLCLSFLSLSSFISLFLLFCLQWEILHKYFFLFLLFFTLIFHLLNISSFSFINCIPLLSFLKLFFYHMFLLRGWLWFR